MIARIAAQLRPLPDVDPAAKAGVLVAVATERERDRSRERVRQRRSRMRRWAGGAALAAAMTFSVFLLGRDRGRAAVATAPEPSAVRADDSLPGVARATLAARDADGTTALLPVQLVFRAPTATRVSVVGDFTGWDSRQAVMTRDSGSGLWSVALALPPGRHVYAFLVDDSVWVRDPRAPAAPDADFGRPGSVLLVGRP